MLDPGGCEDAEKLAFHHRRIAERPQQVEDGARPQFDADRPDMAHRAVVTGCHQEAGSRFPQGTLHKRQVAVDVDAERGQHVGRAQIAAEAAGVELDPIMKIQEGGGYAPQPKKMYRAMAMEMDAASVPIAAGTQEIRATVNLVIAIE